ncbi:MAG: Holliday junction ATP-dependent DNA helicase RuvA [candidate division TM6 bacterium GW2011_GWE2_41_16]|nr:MAG: Holliday junction ATP-dependent DNA helicase RuvA [candidate division TM6 bacterium GW2011_GWE2_41_16]
MIARICGHIVDTQASALVVDAGGVGYLVHVPRATSYAIGAHTTLMVSYRFSSENGPSLYGFTSTLERDLFNLITSCSGIGPKLGLALLEDLSAQNIVDAIIRSDDTTLCSVSGVGKKKAELIVHSLRDKIQSFVPLLAADQSSPQQGSSQTLYELGLALGALGYSRIEIKKATHAVAQLHDLDTLPFDTVLRKSLLMLSAGN